MLDADFFRRWLTLTAVSVDREADRLTELDSPIGDADHGSNLRRGFTAVSAALEKDPPATPRAVLQLAGRQLISTVGGASGPLYGTLLRSTGKALGDTPEVTEAEFAAALRAGVDAVMQLGGAVPGDKTMIDALVPAVGALEEGVGAATGQGAAAGQDSRVGQEPSAGQSEPAGEEASAGQGTPTGPSPLTAQSTRTGQGTPAAQDDAPPPQAAPAPQAAPTAQATSAAAFAAAAASAEQGALATTPLQARKGRASYLGERSIGHQDPGATSAALLIGALVAAAGGEGA